ncbi:hypothetical protein [Paraburkholderia sp. Ac-20347]|uniref:hypothetical protein n=1 Tax=Paraburkholderia sp. Ac-20347 TaxID=2703892 RepID=UPI00197EC319|nr:hypothetical protein [Paraburkholderia sp. Ac-20347]MBN3808174.1 hypothetical protein [Paraburkholderia sp. Ac-20347]
MIKIFEPLYRPGQTLTEPLFSPLVLADNSWAHWREFRILVDFYRQGSFRNLHTGIFSPKFSAKTRVSAQRFLDFCVAHADADVCLINPFPQIAMYSYNVWMQGEANHPGLTESAQALLDECGLGWDLSAVPRHGKDMLCYSNFWVGSERFWEAYVGGVLNRIAVHIENNPQAPGVIAATRDTWHTDAAPFLPFIVERLFSTFLSLNTSLTVAAFDLPDVESYCLTDYERELVSGMQPVIERAEAAGRYPSDLVETQALLCRLYVRYAREHFAVNTHPHSGKTVDDSY